MRKIILTAAVLSAISVSSNVAVAGDGSTATISLTDGIIVNKEAGEAREFTKESLAGKKDELQAQEASTDKDKKSGFLSFFSFFGGQDKEKIQPKENETREKFVARMYSQAKQGDVDALMNLGYMYLYGLNDLEVNYKKAFEYYNLAAQSGDNIALNNLGSLYYSGIGVRKDISKAAELFAQASDLGNIEASLNLAVIYLSHQDNLANVSAAVDLLKKVAKNGNPVGKYLLGYAYFKGFGVPKSNKKAIANIRDAADKSYDEAQYVMGYLYEHGFGVPQNYNNALRYFNRAANQGNISAMMELGDLYASGTRIEKDYYKAHVLFNLSAFYGVPGADKKRDMLSSKLKIPELLQAQTEAENFQPKPSQLTEYIRATFGESLALYIDPRAPVLKRQED